MKATSNGEQLILKKMRGKISELKKVYEKIRQRVRKQMLHTAKKKFKYQIQTSLHTNICFG